jgi:hypothetical protein
MIISRVRWSSDRTSAGVSAVWEGRGNTLSSSSSTKAEDPVRRGPSINNVRLQVLDRPPKPVIGLAEGETRWRTMTAERAATPAVSPSSRSTSQTAHCRCTSAASRRDPRPSSAKRSALIKSEGAGKAGSSPLPWPACNKKARGRTTGSAKTSRPSLRDGFNGLYVISPGTGSLAPVARALVAPQAWHQHRDARTTRLHRPRRAFRPRSLSPAATRRVHRIPLPRP